MAKKKDEAVLPETADQHVERLSRKERTAKLFNNPETFEVLVDHISNGGSPLDICTTWDVRYSDLCRFIQADNVRRDRYAEAGAAAMEWHKQSILREFKRIANVDIRELYTDAGALKPVGQWPESIAKAVAGIETNDLFEGYGKDRERIGETKKVKFWDKLKALELAGKTMAMFTENVEVKGSVTLADLVLASMQPKEKQNETGNTIGTPQSSTKST